MAVSYNNLWKLMIDKKINKSELCKSVKISSSTMAKMTNEEMVAMPILEKICAELECNIGDIMEFTELDEVKKKSIMKLNYESVKLDTKYEMIR